MFSKKSIPNCITVAMGLVGSLSILLLALGHADLSVRLVFLALSLDVLDGYLARRLGAISEKGALLDRLYDRLYQVIVPAIIYLQQSSISPGFKLLSIAYGSILITVAFLRIAEVRPSTLWFTGIPFNIHTIIIISSYIRGVLIPPYVMLLLLIPTILPIRYIKRLGLTSRATDRDAGSLWQLRFSVPLLLAVAPYDRVPFVFEALMALAFIYVLVGWAPLYLFRAEASRA